jgi:hypothetical protein
MRKTIHEWLDSNQKGMGMAKKKSIRRKPPVRLPLALDDAVEGLFAAKSTAKKKPAAKKAIRKRKPR